MRKRIFMLHLILTFFLGIITEGHAQGDAEMGRKLFSGIEGLKNGGISCLSCHNVSGQKIPAGGLLAKDLTNVFGRMGGEAGLTGILGSPPFPAMAYSYKYNPITPGEIDHIVAFLKTADAENPAATTVLFDDGLKTMLIGGGIGIVVFFLLIHILWGNRKRGNVKEDVLAR